MGAQLQSLDRAASFLRGKANRHAWIGLGIAVTALLLANLLACYAQSSTLSVEGLLLAQHANPALWLMDGMPLLFMAWGQYIGIVMSYQAGAMLLDETRELREHTSALEYQLEHSSGPGQIPGLLNRHAFTKRLSRLIPMLQERDSSCAVLIIGTEQYHEVAQAHGDAAAREFTAQLAQRLQAVLRDETLAGHFGYDDFAVLLPVRGIVEAKNVARRIEQALDTPLTIQRHPISLRSSIGIALYPEHGADADTVIRRAETAKYAALAARREHLVYSPELENTQTETPQLIAELHAALDHDGLVAEYLEQKPCRPELPPRVRLIPHWAHPRLGRLEESGFINLPGRRSLVQSVALWLLQEGLSRVGPWRREIHPELMLSLRLPDRAFSDTTLIDTVTRLLTAHDFPAGALVLETHESALTGGGETAQHILQSLRSKGVQIHLGGVGAPGASPATALYFPISEIGLAPALVSRAVGQESARKLLGHTIHVVRDLGLGVVAVELDTPQMLSLVEPLAVDYVEGTAVRPSFLAEEIEHAPAVSGPLAGLVIIPASLQSERGNV